MSFPSRRALFLLLGAVALVLAGAAVVAADGVESSTALQETTGNSSSVLIDVQNSTNYLSPDAENVTRREYEAATLDVAGAVQGDALRLKGEHRERVLEERLENASDGDAVEREAVPAFERSVRDLERQQRQLYRDYSQGRIDTTRLFRELVRLDVAGEQYRDLVQTVRENGSMSETVELRYSNLDGELALFPSPVVSHIESGLATGSRTPLYVQGGNESLVLATVGGDTYVREAVLFSERDRDAPERFGTGGGSEAEDAFDRTRELYPWTMDDSFGPELRGFGNTSVYRLRASHSHGELQTYIDGATTNPFYEIQEKNPFAVPVTDFTQTTSDGLRLDIQLTSPTGPMRIEVIETSNLDYENITVSVDGDTVANLSSGDDFYTVQPVGTFEVSAETDAGDEVSIALFPE